MVEIKNKKQLIRNLETIEQYLQSEFDEVFNPMAKLIANGKVFVAYLVDGDYHFAPSRFVGYRNNTLKKHEANTSKDGRVTNRSISKVLDQSNCFYKELEKHYITYCLWLGVIPSKKDRTYWLIDENLANEFTSPHFTEGSRKLITHEVRERNQKVVKEAKRLFRREHNGELFCEICGFNFKAVYGKVGDGFIEAHHKVSLSSMAKEHKVNPSDLMMVCPNCHRMLHRQVNGSFISIKQLQRFLRKTE